MKTVLAAVLLLFTLSLSAFAQDEANVDQLTWLTGSWKGDGFGGTSEETWSAAENGVMMGMFRHHKADGSLNFYEFLVISADGLRLKHFNPDMTGWEEKDDFLHFKFKSQGADFVEFGGLKFEMVGEDRMNISLKMRRGDGLHTEVFHMQRVNTN